MYVAKRHVARALEDLGIAFCRLIVLLAHGLERSPIVLWAHGQLNGISFYHVCHLIGAWPTGRIVPHCLIGA